jgi:hypothetical protein
MLSAFGKENCQGLEREIRYGASESVATSRVNACGMPKIYENLLYMQEKIILIQV